MPDKGPIRILSVDDHPLFRGGIATIIRNQPDMLLVSEAANCAEALQRYREHNPDVTLMEVRLPDMCGIEAITAIRTVFPEARIIVLTTFEGDIQIQSALQAGASGYLFKSMPPEVLLEAIRQVHGGKKRVPVEVAVRVAEHIADEALTEREIDVLREVADGNHNRAIAQRLFVTEATIKTHVKNIMGKLGASDRTQAVAIALRRGIIRL